ncbi:MAG: hypothetical protein ABIN13_06855 [Mucilaginibacter sp.]
MNKLYTIIIVLSIAASFAGCKKDGKQPIKTIVNNNSTLIVGNWARSKTIDTVNTEGTVNIDSANVNNDYGFVFKADGTGSVSQLGLKVFDIKYAMLTGKIGINVTQGYNQDGTPSTVHIIPYSVNFVKLTATELVLRRDTTMILSGTAVSHVITVDHYTKR